MIGKIIDGILNALRAEFGDTYTFYTEGVEPQVPCFLVFCTNLNTDVFRAGRYLHQNQFSIQYLTAAQTPRTDCANVAERLFSCLELISVDGNFIRGTGMHAEIADAVLHFSVNYNFYSDRSNDAMKMEALEGTEVNMKG